MQAELIPIIVLIIFFIALIASAIFALMMLNPILKERYTIDFVAFVFFAFLSLIFVNADLFQNTQFSDDVHQVLSITWAPLILSILTRFVLINIIDDKIEDLNSKETSTNRILSRMNNINIFAYFHINSKIISSTIAMSPYFIAILYISLYSFWTANIGIKDLSQLISALKTPAKEDTDQKDKTASGDGTKTTNNQDTSTGITTGKKINQTSGEKDKSGPSFTVNEIPCNNCIEKTTQVLGTYRSANPLREKSKDGISCYLGNRFSHDLSYELNAIHFTVMKKDMCDTIEIDIPSGCTNITIKSDIPLLLSSFKKMSPKLHKFPRNIKDTKFLLSKEISIDFLIREPISLSPRHITKIHPLLPSDWDDAINGISIITITQNEVENQSDGNDSYYLLYWHWKKAEDAILLKIHDIKHFGQIYTQSDKILSYMDYKTYQIKEKKGAAKIFHNEFLDICMEKFKFSPAMQPKRK